MVKLLTEEEIDPIQEQVDLALDDAEGLTPRLSATDTFGDLSDGGKVGGAYLYPTSQGKHLNRQARPQAKGRAAARRAWMWNGTESTLPLAWNPDGTRHDGARAYLTKRHCLCCHSGGFRGLQCPNCVKSGCDRCGSSTDRKKIIPNFYLRQEDVPFPERFYGAIDCFLTSCPRRDTKGFKTEQDMRIHARSRHRMEYQAHTESQTAARSDEIESLRRRLDAMTANARPERTPEQKGRDAEKMAKARAARASK